MDNLFSGLTPKTVLEVYVGMQLYSALIQSLPTPEETGGIWYRAVYNFLSILGNDFKSFSKAIPQFKALSAAPAEKGIQTNG
jgi:hypothetical protein